MMHDWSEQEEKMRERFPRRHDSNLRRPNDNRSDKGQRDFSGPPRKRKPDDVIAAIDRPSRGKKSTTQEEFEKLLQKKCPWHPGANHAAIDCYHLRRTFSNSGGGRKNKKPVDKEPKDDDQEDHGRNPKFQDASKVVNVIFGGDEDFCSRQDQKLLLREIMSIEPAVPRPLRWSEVPISFSRDDHTGSNKVTSHEGESRDTITITFSITEEFMLQGFPKEVRRFNSEKRLQTVKTKVFSSGKHTR
jgi:hypothetical protein